MTSCDETEERVEKNGENLLGARIAGGEEYEEEVEYNACNNKSVI